MSPASDEAPLWAIVKNLEYEAIEAWRKEYRPSLSVEDAVTQHINVVETTVARRPGGNILVTVAVTAKKAFECDVTVNRLQRAGNRVYKVIDPISPSS